MLAPADRPLCRGEAREGAPLVEAGLQQLVVLWGLEGDDGAGGSGRRWDRTDEVRPELLRPAADGLLADCNVSFGEALFHIAVAQ